MVPHAVVWTFTQQVTHIQSGDRLAVRTNCPGVLTWQVDEREAQTAELQPVGGVMAGVSRYNLTLGPFPAGTEDLRFRFYCTHAGCEGQDLCCEVQEHTIHVDS
jgi:hypothetical protein